MVDIKSTAKQSVLLFPAIASTDIHWIDASGTTHSCVGADGDGAELPTLWTLCWIEVPLYAARSHYGAKIDCLLCLAGLAKAGIPAPPASAE
jgi:hypothetical protein